MYRVLQKNGKHHLNFTSNIYLKNQNVCVRDMTFFVCYTRSGINAIFNRLRKRRRFSIRSGFFFFFYVCLAIIPKLLD